MFRCNDDSALLSRQTVTWLGRLLVGWAGLRPPTNGKACLLPQTYFQEVNTVLSRLKAASQTFAVCSSETLARVQFTDSSSFCAQTGAECRWQWRPTCWGRTRWSRRSGGLRWTRTSLPALSTSARRPQRSLATWKTADSTCSTKVNIWITWMKQLKPVLQRMFHVLIDGLFTQLFLILSLKTQVWCISDEDGDLVAFSSDDELLMGLACMKDSTFRIFIKGTDVTVTSWLAQRCITMVTESGVPRFRWMVS